jgi:hypothetical protein
MEQKCSSSLPSRKGIDSVSSTCMPQTGSRTSRRASEPEVCVEPRCTVDALFCSAPRNSRRSSHTLQETTRSQNRNRTMRPRNVMSGKDYRTTAEPPSSTEVSVCKAKRASQTKRRTFKRLRGGSTRCGSVMSGQIQTKLFIFSTLSNHDGFHEDIDAKAPQDSKKLEKTLLSSLECGRCPCMGAALQGLGWNHLAADNFPQWRSRFAQQQVRNHSTCVQNRSSRRL